MYYSIFMTHIDTSMKPCMYTCNWNQSRTANRLGSWSWETKALARWTTARSGVLPSLLMAACLVTIWGLSKNWGPRKSKSLSWVSLQTWLLYTSILQTDSKPIGSCWRGDHVPIDEPLGIGSRTWCRPSLSGAAAKWSLPTRTPSSSTGWRMPRGSSDHGMDAARKSQKWLGWKEGVYLWLSSVWIEAGSHVERLSLDLMWTKALLERNNDRSGSNTMKQEISCATSRVWHTTPIWSYLYLYYCYHENYHCYYSCINC